MSSAIPFSPLSPKSGLRYAACVGRVGALAVALGVGLAVASTPGVAHADGSTDSSQSSDGTAAGSTDAKDAVTKADSANDRRQSRVSERRPILRALSLAASNPERAMRPVRQRPVVKDNDLDTPTTQTAGATAKSGDNATKSGDSATRVAAASGARTRVTARKDLDRPAPPLVSAPHVHTDRSVARSLSSTESITSDGQSLETASGQSSTGPRQYVTETRTSEAPFTRALAITPTPVPTPGNAAAAAPATFVSSVLAAVGFGPSAAPTRSPAPAPTPFAWAVLGFVRRELELAQRTFLNRTPIATNDTVPTAGGSPITEDGAFTFDPRTNDVDRDRGDVLTITGVTNGQYGTVTTNGTSVTYTPNAEAQRLAAGDTVTDTFTYTISDADSAPHIHGLLGLFGRGHTATATVTVTLTGTNDAPNVLADSVTEPIDEDSTGAVIAVLGNDTDVDRGDVLKIDSVTQGTLGSVTRNADGTVTYTPTAAADVLAAGERRTDTFTYTVSDRSGATNTATVSVVVLGTDDPPVAAPDTLAINENAGPTVVNVLTNDTDAERDTLTVTAVTMDPSVRHFGTVTATGGVVTYTPNADALALNAGDTGTDKFTYTVEDGKGGIATGEVTVTVRGVNDAVVVSTGTSTPVDVEWWSPGAGLGYGYIRNLDGTLSKVSFDEETGWSVGAGVQYDAGAVALDARTVYAYDYGDGSLALIDADTGAVVGRAVDRVGVKYQFGDVTDVALDSRADSGQADVVYTVDSSGVVTAIDATTGVVVATADTRDASGGTAESFAAAAVTTSSPRVAVAPGGSKIYVADGRRIAVVTKQPATAARAVDGESAIAATELVYDRSLDLDVGGQVTAMEVSANGDRIYATVATVDASGAAASRLVAINVRADGTLAVADSVAVGPGARSLALNDDLNRAYVVSADDRTVSVVGLGDLNVVRTIDAGTSGTVAVVPSRDAILVSNPDAHAISVISDAPITIDLNWGAQPRDLDAHLIGPTGSGGTFHIYYANKTYSVARQDGGQEVRAFLNVDDTDGNGPEIVQIDTRTPGVYHYYVVNYSGETSFAPGTVVTLRDPQSGITQTLDVGDAHGSGRYWSVFTVTVSDTGAVTVAPDNTLSNNNPDPSVPLPGAQIAL